MIMIIEVKYLVFYSAAHGTMSCDKKRSGRIIRLHCNLRNYIVRELIMIIDIKYCKAKKTQKKQKKHF